MIYSIWSYDCLTLLVCTLGINISFISAIKLFLQPKNIIENAKNIEIMKLMFMTKNIMIFRVSV